MHVNEEEAIKMLKDELGEGLLDSWVARRRRAYAIVRPGDHRSAISGLLRRLGYIGISTVTGVDLGKELELNYHLKSGGLVLTVRSRVPKERPEIQTIIDLLPGATLYEREVSDLFGVTFTGNTSQERLLLPESWPENVHPLIKGWKPEGLSEGLEDVADSEVIGPPKGDETIRIVVGPQHPALHEPERFMVEVDGERVVEVYPRIGYVHRGIEKGAEGLSFLQDVHLIERICGICNIAHTTCYCQAVEEIGGIEVPPRGRYLRTIVAELNRIHSHTLFLGVAGLELGFESLFMYMWRDREPVLDVIEELTGNRILTAFNTIGGVRRDLSPDVAKKMLKTLGKTEEAMGYYKKVFGEDPTLRLRTEGVGPLKGEDALRLGAVGPTLRGSGVSMDVRKDDPYAAYDEVPFGIVTYDTCDVWGRLMVRVDEVHESIGIIRHAVEHLPRGAYRVRVPRRIPEGEAVSRVEAPRGEDIHYVKSNGSAFPERVKVRSPTLSNILPLCDMMRGCNIADIPAVIVSIDPCFSCTDRMVFVDPGRDRRWSMSINEIRERRRR